MIDLIPDINSNLQEILMWFKNLYKEQQESIASQLGDSFPFLDKEESHQTTPEELITFVEQHLQDSSSNPRKSLLFYSMVRAGIEMILHDLPNDSDEFLDWYSRRKSFFDEMDKTANKYGRKGIFEDRQDYMKKQFEMLIHTKSSWLDAVTKFKF